MAVSIATAHPLPFGIDDLAPYSYSNYRVRMIEMIELLEMLDRTIDPKLDARSGVIRSSCKCECNLEISLRVACRLPDDRVLPPERHWRDCFMDGDVWR